MASKLQLSSVICLVALTTYAQPTNRLHFPVTGFSIAPLEAPSASSAQQALMMFLPATDGFAPNVNVQIQPYPGTIEEYVALSLKQFKSADLKVLQQKTLGKSAALFEYAGKMEGRALHWYARVEQKAGKVYLATATATDEQWSKVSPRLKTCVDSFRFD